MMERDRRFLCHSTAVRTVQVLRATTEIKELCIEWAGQSVTLVLLYGCVHMCVCMPACLCA